MSNIKNKGLIDLIKLLTTFFIGMGIVLSLEF